MSRSPVAICGNGGSRAHFRRLIGGGRARFMKVAQQAARDPSAGFLSGSKDRSPGWRLGQSARPYHRMARCQLRGRWLDLDRIKLCLRRERAWRKHTRRRERCAGRLFVQATELLRCHRRGCLIASGAGLMDNQGLSVDAPYGRPSIEPSNFRAVVIGQHPRVRCLPQ